MRIVTLRKVHSSIGSVALCLFTQLIISCIVAADQQFSNGREVEPVLNFKPPLAIVDAPFFLDHFESTISELLEASLAVKNDPLRYIFSHFFGGHKTGKSDSSKKPSCETYSSSLTVSSPIDRLIYSVKAMMLASCFPLTTPPKALITALSESFAEDLQQKISTCRNKVTSTQASPVLNNISRWTHISDRLQLLDVLTNGEWEDRNSVIQTLLEFLQDATLSAPSETNPRFLVDVFHALLVSGQAEKLISRLPDLNSIETLPVEQMNSFPEYLFQLVDICQHVPKTQMRVSAQTQVESIIDSFLNGPKETSSHLRYLYKSALMMLQSTGKPSACPLCIHQLKPHNAATLVWRAQARQINQTVNLRICPLLSNSDVKMATPKIHFVDDHNNISLAMEASRSEQEFCSNGLDIPNPVPGFHSVLVQFTESLGLVARVSKSTDSFKKALASQNTLKLQVDAMPLELQARVKLASQEHMSVSLHLFPAENVQVDPASQHLDFIYTLQPIYKKPALTALIFEAFSDNYSPFQSAVIIPLEKTESSGVLSVRISLIQLVSQLALSQPATVVVSLMSHLYGGSKFELVTLSITDVLISASLGENVTRVTVDHPVYGVYTIPSTEQFWHPKPVFADANEPITPNNMTFTALLFCVLMISISIIICREMRSRFRGVSAWRKTKTSFILDGLVIMSGGVVFIYWLQLTLLQLMKLLLVHIPVVYVAQQLWLVQRRRLRIAELKSGLSSG